MNRIGISSSGIYTVKEYLPGKPLTPPVMVRLLQEGPFEVLEVITYVFEGEDPLGIDAKSFSAEDFRALYPKLDRYGSGLAIDVIVATDGQPVTVELTKDELLISTSSLDREIELDELLPEDFSSSDPVREGDGIRTDAEPDRAKPDRPESDRTESDRQESDRPESDRPGSEKKQETSAEMTPEQFLAILTAAEKLKCHTRHCDTSSGRRESVAEHSWRLALMAMLLSGKEEFAALDMDRVIRMCLIHDLGEIFTGDIPTFEKTQEDTQREEDLLNKWICGFPDVQRSQFQALFAEMDLRKTGEARLYKALDKMEALIQHNESDLSSWLPREYDLQLTYGRQEMQFSPFLRSVREKIDDWTKKKISEGV